MGNDEQNAGPGDAPIPPNDGNDDRGAGRGRRSSRAPEQQIEKLEQDKRELHDRLLRLAAEFENYKKRSKKEIDDAATRGREQLLKELLPVLDNLERALKHAPHGDPLPSACSRRRSSCLQALEKFGVTRFVGGRQAVRSGAARRHPAGRDEPTSRRARWRMEFARLHARRRACCARRWWRWPRPRRRPRRRPAGSDDSALRVI